MVAGCGDDPEEAEVKQVLTDQLEFLRAEDIEGVLSTMHPESPQYAATRSLLEQVFELYELDHELESIEVVEMSEKEAKIRAVQVTYRVDGPELSDTKVTAIHTMRKTDGGWKLYNSETESSETL
jgi:ketosteroid isomerase-like protein